MPYTFLQPLRHAARALVRSPGFTLPVLALLTLGIGATSGLVAGVDALLLEPLSFPEAHRIVQVSGVGEDLETTELALQEVLDLDERADGLAAVGAYRRRSFGLTGGIGEGDSPVAVVQVGLVTPGFFDALGIQPLRGRTFRPYAEGGGEPSVVLTEELSRRQLGGGDGRKVIGRTVELNDRPVTVVGVVPTVELPMRGHLPEAFIPLDREVYGRARTQRSLQMVARLAPGVEPSAAAAELEVLSEQLAAAHPEAGDDRRFVLQSLEESLRGPSRRPLALLVAAAAVLLLIVCANLASLLAARQESRLHGAAVRTALGAGGGHLVRSALTEGVLLAAAGALSGLLLAHAITASLPQTLELLGETGPARVRTERLDLTPDGTTLVATLVLAALLALLLGTTSAAAMWRAERAGVRPLLEAGRAATGGGARSARFHGALVVGQIALSVVLLASSGLLLRSLDELLSTDPGFQATGVLGFGIGLPEASYGPEERVRFHRRLSQRLEKVPGVEHAGIVSPLPLTGAYRTRFELEGRSLQDGPLAAVGLTAPGALQALEIPLLRGRVPTWRDNLESPRVLVVNRSFRERFLPEGALGKRLQLSWFSELTPRAVPREIVGVVDDVRQEGLDRPAEPQIYLPASQFPLEGGVYVVRTSRGDSGVAEEVRRTVRELDPRLQKIEVRPLPEMLGEKLGARRSAIGLLGAFAVAALLLTAIGLYGLLSYQVAQRRPELAVRSSLGAARSRLIGLVVARTLGLAAFGLALGLAGAVAAGRALESRLYEVSPTDPAALVVTAAVMLLAALGASALPARRAASIPPREVLS